MRVGSVSLILLFVFCGNCMFITWSASDENHRNLPLVKKGKLQWGKFLKLGTSGKKEDEGREDAKGKRPAVESDSPKAGTSSKVGPLELHRWTNEQKEDLLRVFFTHQTKRPFKELLGGSNWDEISDVWIAKHGNMDSSRLQTHIYYMKSKMQAAAEKFDNQRPSEIGLPWMEWMTDCLMRIYYKTEKGDKSKHGERMRDMWVMLELPGYQRVKSDYLLTRAEAMLQSVRKITPAVLNSDVHAVLKPGQQLLWTKDHEDFLEELWRKYQPKKQCRREKIFDEAVAKFRELEAVGVTRVYERAKFLHNRNRKVDDTSGSAKKKMKKGESEKFIVDGYINWKPEHDEYLPSLWKAMKDSGPRQGRLERFHHEAVLKFSEMSALTPLQLYDRAKYVERKMRLCQKQTIADHQAMRGTHVQYHTFIDDQMTPSIDRGTHYHPEWNACTSSQPGPSHQQSDLGLSLKTLNVGEQSPDTNLKLR